jgi:hypothetical protein
MSKICQNCAQELPDTATVCNLCGAPLAPSPQPQYAQQPPQPQQQYQQPAQPQQQNAQPQPQQQSPQQWYTPQAAPQPQYQQQTGNPRPMRAQGSATLAGLDLSALIALGAALALFVLSFLNWGTVGSFGYGEGFGLWGLPGMLSDLSYYAGEVTLYVILSALLLLTLVAGLCLVVFSAVKYRGSPRPKLTAVGFVLSGIAAIAFFAALLIAEGKLKELTYGLASLKATAAPFITLAICAVGAGYFFKKSGNPRNRLG